MLITLNPEDSSAEVPITIIDDVMLEDDELFQGSLSIPANPPSGLGPSPTAGVTTITILDNESRLMEYARCIIFVSLSSFFNI